MSGDSKSLVHSDLSRLWVKLASTDAVFLSSSTFMEAAPPPHSLVQVALLVVLVHNMAHNTEYI